MGQVNFWYDLRHDKTWEIQSTWMSLGQGLLSFCCFPRFLMVNPCFRILMVNPYFPRNLVIYSDGLMRLMVYQCLLCFGCLLLRFAECLGEPEVFKSKSIARGWASCWADQAFALCRWNSMDLKMRRYEILRCKSFSKRFWEEIHVLSFILEVMESGTIGVMVQSVNDGYDSDIIQVLDGQQELGWVPVWFGSVADSLDFRSLTFSRWGAQFSAGGRLLCHGEGVETGSWTAWGDQCETVKALEIWLTHCWFIVDLVIGGTFARTWDPCGDERQSWQNQKVRVLKLLKN